MYAMYAIGAPVWPNALPPPGEFALSFVFLSLLGYGIGLKYRPLQMQWRFDSCAKCEHAKWCLYSKDEYFAPRIKRPKRPKGKPEDPADNVPEQVLYRDMPFAEQMYYARKCATGCFHIATEPCGEESEHSQVGKCHHLYEMCIMPKKHRKPATWATIMQIDNGRSTVEWIDVEHASEADREAHRVALRKKWTTKTRRAAASSPEEREDAEQVPEPA